VDGFVGVCEGDDDAPLVLVHAESRRAEACPPDANDDAENDWCGAFATAAADRRQAAAALSVPKSLLVTGMRRR
jgi:hypothetical protein